MAGAPPSEENTYSELEIHDPEPELKEVDFTKLWNVNISDVTFLVEDKKVYGSKGVLAMWSPVMEAMFFHDFKEKSSMAIPLPDKKYEDIVELMKVLHPPIKGVDDNNVAVLLPLAREYQMKELTKRCEDFLLSKPESMASLVLADEYSLPKLREKCMKYTESRRFSQLTSEIGWEDMSKDTKITILLEKMVKYEPLVAKYEAKCKSTSETLHTIEAISTGSMTSQNTCRTTGLGSNLTVQHEEGTLSTCKNCSHYQIQWIRAALEKRKQ